MNNYGTLTIGGTFYNSGTINNNFYAVQTATNTFETSYAKLEIPSYGLGGNLVNYNIANANKQNDGNGYLEGTADNGSNIYITAKQDGKINNYSPNFTIKGALTNYPENGIYATAGSTINVVNILDIVSGSIKVYSNVLNVVYPPGYINNKSNITYIDDKQYFGLSYNYQTDDTIYFTIKIDDGSTIYENGIDQDPPNDDTFRINIGDYDDGGLFSHDTHNIQSFIDAYAKKHDNHKTLKLDKTMFGVLTGCHACRVNVLLGTTANIPQPDPRTNDARVYSTSPFIYNAVTGNVVDINGNVLP